MHAFLKNYRQAPRKVRLVARSVGGKRVDQALGELSLMPQKGAAALKKLISSAVSNAAQIDSSASPQSLSIRSIRVDKGITYVRSLPRAFGRASPMHRECSHIHVELERTTDKVLKTK